MALRQLPLRPVLFSLPGYDRRAAARALSRIGRLDRAAHSERPWRGRHQPLRRRLHLGEFVHGGRHRGIPGWVQGAPSLADGGRALGRHELAARADPQSPGRVQQHAEGRLVSVAERLLRSGLLGNCPELTARIPGDSETADRALERDELVDPVGPGRPEWRAPRPSPAPGSWPAPRSGTPTADPSPNAGTAAGTFSPPRNLRVRTDVSCPLRRTCTAVGVDGPTDSASRRALVRAGQLMGLADRA